MSLLTLRGARLDFGGPALLDDVDFALDRGERVCLLGRNGVGKSTLLALLLGRLPLDGGELVHDPALRIADLPQDIPVGAGARIREVVAEGLGDLAAAVTEYEALAAEGSEADSARLAALGEQIDAGRGWDLSARTDRVLSQLNLDGEAVFESLSGGSRRRVLLARALVAEPDVLILDEPTNHLDVETIEWLEGVLDAFDGALLFTSHDRRFVQQLSTRIVELDRGVLTSYPGDWRRYQEQREARHAAAAAADAEFDRRLAEEEVWIRQGIKARRTRNEGRVRRLEAMRETRRARRQEVGAARMSVREADRSGKKVIEAEGLSFSWPGAERPIVLDFSTLIERGDRVGILGRNGTGKTTLLNLLLKSLEPASGVVTHGTKMALAVFDQHRADIDTASERGTTLQDFVADGDDHVETADGRRHVIGWLQDFLFTPARSRGPVSVLSGGERARLQLARLFARPSNVLVMDEPTNDLDVETLELLEERILDYAGTVLMVSHDREFLDRVVTSTLALEANGRVGEYVGGWSDWRRQRPVAKQPAPADASAKATREAATTTPSKTARKKLSYKDQRELDALPAQIEALEARIGALQRKLADPELYRGDADAVAELKTQLIDAETSLEAAFERWSDLEG
ncbi:MAG: ATP-binding cassette domain-containing protein [Pseudomonadota bacterium]|nr:ATP-binding cassette domain-containing protein [Pseudomonadota bacterium]